LGERPERLELAVGRVLAEDPFERSGRRFEEGRRSLFQSRVCPVERGDAVRGEVELVPAGAEGGAAEVAVPSPVEVGCVELLRRDAAARGGVLAAGNLRVVEHVGRDTAGGERVRQASSHTTPPGPALTTQTPSRSPVRPLLPWTWPQTTSLGRTRRIASRIA